MTGQLPITKAAMQIVVDFKWDGHALMEMGAQMQSVRKSVEMEL